MNKQPELCTLDTAVKLADNAFDKSTKFTFRVATRHLNYIALILCWLVVLTFIILKHVL